MAGEQINAIAQVYAGALLDIATQDDVVDDVSTQLNAIGEIVKADESFASFIDSPVIGINKKKDSLDKIFSNSVSELVMNFLMVITEKGRLSLLLSIVDAFAFLQDQRAGRVLGTVITAVDMSDAELEYLTVKVSKKLDKTVTLTTEVDPSILGGFILKVDGTLIDGSVKRGLKRAKSQLVNASISATLNTAKYLTE